MNQCRLCPSYAINPGDNGRSVTDDLDVCDVCYWRQRSEWRAAHILRRIRAIEPNPLATSPAQAVRFALKDAEGIICEELGGE